MANRWWMLLICTGQGLGVTARTGIRLHFTENGSDAKSIYIYKCQCKALGLLEPKEGGTPVLCNNGKYLPNNMVWYLNTTESLTREDSSSSQPLPEEPP